MFDSTEAGVLYSEHSRLKAMAPGVASLWSFETRIREHGRRRITQTPDGSNEYWLERSDPLLNTILPGTGVSLIVNFGDLWEAGRSPATSAFLPRDCVVGPVTQARILDVGRFVRAIGAGFPATFAPTVLGVPATDLVDRIVPLRDLWPRNDVERLSALSPLEIRRCVSVLMNDLVRRTGRPTEPGLVGESAVQFIKLHAGRISIDDMAHSYGLNRQQFARKFRTASGLPPKLFARITRFQALVQALLSTDVSQWASLSPAVGFYDQAHMINDFRAFAGSPPTVFFRPRCSNIDPGKIQFRGRPGEWSIRRGALR